MVATDINRALLEALAQVDPERATVVIFLTDGLPTEGVVEVPQILSNVAASAPDTVRLFPFGVGDDVNTTLLDTLAEEHGGTTGYVRPDERIDEEVSAFYAKISTPVLSNIEFDFDDTIVEDTYPEPLPDLFAGSQLILTGRYRGEGPTRIALTGEVEGEERSFIYEGTFSETGGNPFIPRLWAARKIGYLLTQIRLHGEREEWVDAVIELSTRYGIVTPYTSFLIQEDLWTEGGREEAAEQFLAMPTPPAAGAPAVEMADSEAGLRAAEAVGGETLPAEVADMVRHAGTKTFVLHDGVWTDTAFDPEAMTPVEIGFNSETYFDLLAAEPAWGQYMAVGTEVLWVAEGTVYQIVDGETGPVTIPTAEPGTSTPVPATPGASGSTRTQPSSGGELCGGLTLTGLLLGFGLAGWLRRR